MPLLTKPRPLFRQLYEDWYQLYDHLEYQDIETGEIYKVEGGTKWDMGTILKIVPRFFVPHADQMTYPSALHDKFYADFSVTRAVADRILRQFLIEEGLAKWRAWGAWTFVRMNLKAEYRWEK